MENDNLPKVPGIYQIFNLVTGKSYVGSSKSLYNRFYEHRKRLQWGKHVNRHLQSAWNKYGKAAFEYRILETCPISELVEREQYWMDLLQVCDPDHGYNSFPNARTSLGRTVSPDVAEAQALRLQHAWPGWIDPDGNEVTIINLKKFCRDHGFNEWQMQNIYKGKGQIKSHRGWTHKNNLPKGRAHLRGTYRAIAPDNTVYTITDLRAFCKEHNLNLSSMQVLLCGKPKIAGVKGWRRYQQEDQ